MTSRVDATSLARPYARAAFEYAKEHQQIAPWSQLLQTVAQYVQQPVVMEILNNPQYDAKTRAEIVESFVDTSSNAQFVNFIQLLAERQRLLALPQIYELFEQQRAELEKVQQVTVKSAIALTEKNIQQLQASLQKQLGEAVEIACEIDPELIGGFMVYAKDKVLDYSLRGRFEKLRNEVTVY